uniref:Triadin-like n=1 Tax=Steinernema glaseri TaxID=37863 RepID=A0A1I7YNE4_9BILA
MLQVPALEVAKDTRRSTAERSPISSRATPDRVQIRHSVCTTVYIDYSQYQVQGFVANRAPSNMISPFVLAVANAIVVGAAVFTTAFNCSKKPKQHPSNVKPGSKPEKKIPSKSANTAQAAASSSAGIPTPPGRHEGQEKPKKDEVNKSKMANVEKTPAKSKIGKLDEKKDKASKSKCNSKNLKVEEKKEASKKKEEQDPEEAKDPRPAEELKEEKKPEEDYPDVKEPTPSIKKKKEEELEKERKKGIESGFYQSKSDEDDTLEPVKSLKEEGSGGDSKSKKSLVKKA